MLAAGLVLTCFAGVDFRLPVGPIGVGDGVDWSDANLAGSLIGQKLAIMNLSLISISRHICKRVALWI